MTDRTAFILLVAWVLTAPVFLGSVAEAVPAPGPLGAFIGAGGGYALFHFLENQSCQSRFHQMRIL